MLLQHPSLNDSNMDSEDICHFRKRDFIFGIQIYQIRSSKGIMFPSSTLAFIKSGYQYVILPLHHFNREII